MSKPRFLMDLNLNESASSLDPGATQISLSDYQELGKLLWQADQGTVDDEGGSIEESVKELKDTLEGKYGRFLPKCSFKLIDRGTIVAAVILTFYEEENMPLVAFTMTHPRKKNRGLCQRLLKSAAAALMAEGFANCFLAVTAANLPAVKAYQKVGFTIRQ